MSADFGADLDAALNGALAAVRATAQAAKQRIDEGIAGIPAAAPVPDFPTPNPAPRRPSAAVSFDIVESPLEFAGPPHDDDLHFDAGMDAEGIPFPEDHPGH